MVTRLTRANDVNIHISVCFPTILIELFFVFCILIAMCLRSVVLSIKVSQWIILIKNILGVLVTFFENDTSIDSLY